MNPQKKSTCKKPKTEDELKRIAKKAVWDTFKNKTFIVRQFANPKFPFVESDDVFSNAILKNIPDECDKKIIDNEPDTFLQYVETPIGEMDVSSVKDLDLVRTRGEWKVRIYARKKMTFDQLDKIDENGNSI